MDSLAKPSWTNYTLYKSHAHFIRDNPHVNYTKCKCKYLCKQCAYWKPITVINLKEE